MVGILNGGIATWVMSRSASLKDLSTIPSAMTGDMEVQRVAATSYNGKYIHEISEETHRAVYSVTAVQTA